MKEEIWTIYKDTRRYNGWLYEVSNYGRVKLDGEIVEPRVLSNGYLQVGGIFVHQAVAKLYVPNPHNKPEIDHIDGNKLNNRADNLRWVTREENMRNKHTLNKLYNRGSYIHLGNKSKYVTDEYLDYWLDDGWLYGGKQRNAKKRKCYIRLGDRSMYVDIEYLDYWLDDGWLYGGKLR